MKNSVNKPQFLEREESRSGIEPKSFCLPAYCLTANPKRLTMKLAARARFYFWRLHSLSGFFDFILFPILFQREVVCATNNARYINYAHVWFVNSVMIWPSRLIER